MSFNSATQNSVPKGHRCCEINRRSYAVHGSRWKGVEVLQYCKPTFQRKRLAHTQGGRLGGQTRGLRRDFHSIKHLCARNEEVRTRLSTSRAIHERNPFCNFDVRSQMNDYHEHRIRCGQEQWHRDSLSSQPRWGWFTRKTAYVLLINRFQAIALYQLPFSSEALNFFIRLTICFDM